MMPLTRVLLSKYCYNMLTHTLNTKTNNDKYFELQTL